jgi:hypothetical protein
MDLQVKTESNKNKKAAVGVISLPEYIDELGFDDSFLQECACNMRRARDRRARVN